MMKMINDNQDLLDALTPKSGEIYNKDKVYPNNSVVITSDQYKEYMKLKAQIEKVDEVDEDEEVEVDEDEEVNEKQKLPLMKVRVNKNKNIVIDELEDMFIDEDKKQK